MAERHEIAARYNEGRSLDRLRTAAMAMTAEATSDRTHRLSNAAANVERYPGLDDAEQFLALLFLRRYVTYCARRGRYAQMEGAARLARRLQDRHHRTIVREFGG